MISNVTTLRKRVGITQEELARRIGLSRRALSSIEKAAAKPSVDVAIKIARELNVTVEKLFCISDDEESSKTNSTVAAMQHKATS